MTFRTLSICKVTEQLQFTEEQGRIFLTAGDRPERIARRRQLIDSVSVQRGERILEVGCGGGQLSAEIAVLVGPTGRVEGVDISDDMVAAARLRFREQPFSSWVHFTQADAAELPFADGSFDAAVSHMVLEYVNPIDIALRELRRVLRKGGRILVVDHDSDSVVWHSSNPGRMAKVLLAWDEHLVHPWLPRDLEVRLRSAGFTDVRIEPHAILETGEGHYLIDMVAAFVPGRRGVTKEEAVEWADDLHELGRRGRYFFSATLYWFTASVPA